MFYFIIMHCIKSFLLILPAGEPKGPGGAKGPGGTNGPSGPAPEGLPSNPSESDVSPPELEELDEPPPLALELTALSMAVVVEILMARPRTVPMEITIGIKAKKIGVKFTLVKEFTLEMALEFANVLALERVLALARALALTRALALAKALIPKSGLELKPYGSGAVTIL